MRDDEIIGVDERELDDVALEALAEAHATPAPTRLRSRILSRVSPAANVVPLRRSVTVWRMIGAVAATIAVVMTGLYARERGRTETLQGTIAGQSATLASLAQERDTLARRMDTQEKTLVGLRTALESQAQMLRVLSAPRTVTASLAPQEGFSGSGRVLVDAQTGEAHVVLAGLPSPGPGKTYELWAIRGSNPPEPAGLVDVGTTPATAARVERIPSPTDVAAFALSIEPEGGSKSPTGPIVLVGKVT
jgi:anti-sigma-K factor RskA